LFGCRRIAYRTGVSTVDTTAAEALALKVRITVNLGP
jgi:hypothetical protein